jgi:hypothetical protein
MQTKSQGAQNPGLWVNGMRQPIQENTKANFPLLYQVAPFDHSVYNDENKVPDVDMFGRLSRGQATRALMDPRATGFTVNAAAYHSPELALLALHHPLASKRTLDIARIQHGPDHEPGLKHVIDNHEFTLGLYGLRTRGVLPDMHSETKPPI